MMYLAIVGAAAAVVTLIYEYYAFKQTKVSSLGHWAYSAKTAVGSEPFEKNSLNGTDLRRRKLITDVNKGSESHSRAEVNAISSNENSNLYVMKVAKHPARDNKILNDVIRNSEYNEKRYEKNVFNKVKNDLSNLNQNFEEKEISGKNINDSSCVNCEYKATKTLNSSVKYSPLVTIVRDITQNSVKHKFDNAHIEFNGDMFNNQFEKQKESVKIPKPAQQMKLLNIDSSYVCSPSAEEENYSYYNKVQPSISSHTIRLNECINNTDLQPGSSFSCSPPSVELKENIYCNSLQPNSPRTCNIETHTKVRDRHKLYYKYKQRILCDNTAYKKGKKKCAFSQECVSSKRAENISNSDSYSQLAFNTVTKLETSKHINCVEYADQNKNINLNEENSNHVENILTSSINTVKQHPVLSSIEYLKNPIYLRTAEHKFYVSGTERDIGIVNYNQVSNQSKILSDKASLSFAFHLHDKFMPRFQSYISSIKNFVRKHTEIALPLEINNPKSENNTSLSIEHDTEITEVEKVDIGLQISSICDSKSEELSNPSKLHHILCMGCMEVLANTVSVPCGHSYFCTQCAEITSEIYNKCCICHNHVASFEHMTV